MEPWWGEKLIEEARTLRWQLGPKELWVMRGEDEWVIARRVQRDKFDQACTAPKPSAVPMDHPDVEVWRCIRRGEGRTIRVMPALPDRPLVVRPVIPILVPPAEAATLYVSAPLWITVTSPDGSQPILDEAINRPSDTWFGADTAAGTLCYASRANVRLRLDTMDRLPHEAVVPIEVQNRGSQLLDIQRMSVPVQELALSVDDDGTLWTDRLILRQDDRAGATVALSANRSGASAMTPVSEPRALPSKGSLFEAFASRLSAGAIHGG